MLTRCFDEIGQQVCIANGMDAPHGFIEIGQLNSTFLSECASADEYCAGIAKAKG